MITAAALQGLSLFDAMAPAAVRNLVARGIERRYATGQVLFRAGEEAKGLFVIVAGRVRVVRRGAGRGQVVHVEERGGTLGELPLFTETPYPATAIAAEPARCLVFGRDAVHAAIASDPAFALRLLAGLANRTKMLIERLDRLAFASVRARLAAWILSREARSAASVISLGMTQVQLAEELGTVREVVVKELAVLRRAGLVRSRGAGRLEVLDQPRLSLLASGHATSAARERATDGARRGARRPSAGQ